MLWLRTNPKSELALLALILSSAPALAAHPVTGRPTAPCAIVERTVGSSQILDPTRTQVDEAEHGSAVACGGWILSNVGLITLKHRDGYRLTISAGSFVQLPENNTDGRFNGDAVIVFRGQVLAQVPQGSPKFQAITPDGRARLTNAVAALIYSTADEDTQLIAFEGKPTLENRFQSARKVALSPGEASLISRKSLRTLPAAPRALSMTALRAKVEEFGIKDPEREEYLVKGKERAERVFVSAESLKPKSTDGGPLADEVDAKAASRKLASSSPDVVASLKRAARSNIRKKEIQKHLARRLAGGHAASEEIVFPSQFHGQEGQVEVEVNDMASQFEKNHQANEDHEKKRLIEELSHIQAD